jgi:hypothetical protein
MYIRGKENENFWRFVMKVRPASSNARALRILAGLARHGPDSIFAMQATGQPQDRQADGQGLADIQMLPWRAWQTASGFQWRTWQTQGAVRFPAAQRETEFWALEWSMQSSSCGSRKVDPGLRAKGSSRSGNCSFCPFQMHVGRTG